MIEQTISSKKEASEILSFLYSKIINGGLSKQTLIEYQNVSVAPGWTVGELINASIDVGNFAWSKDHLKSVKPVK